MALAGEECTVPSPEPCQEERQAPRASLTRTGGLHAGGSGKREAAERRSGRAGECGPQRQLRLAPAGSTTSAFLAPPRSRGTSGRGTAPGRPRTRARPAAPWMIGSPPPRPPPPRAGGPGEAAPRKRVARGASTLPLRSPVPSWQPRSAAPPSRQRLA
ncbi:unnamed protein product [Prorocentrum cordatum]|uniref:Uncharacterized protein n=1 Tax=Prorocentrum cordatum TaxID=2364126 RepID=A0ABN9UFK1_9DINO|nr:unnamed protein product [Polarella glacialis]